MKNANLLYSRYLQLFMCEIEYTETLVSINIQAKEYPLLHTQFTICMTVLNAMKLFPHFLIDFSFNKGAQLVM